MTRQTVLIVEYLNEGKKEVWELETFGEDENTRRKELLQIMSNTLELKTIISLKFI